MNIAFSKATIEINAGRVESSGADIASLSSSRKETVEVDSLFDDIDFSLLLSKALFEPLNMECSKFHGSRGDVSP